MLKKKNNPPPKPARWATWEEIAGFFSGEGDWLFNSSKNPGPFMDAWAEWCKHRQQKRASLTEVAVRRIIIKLERMGYDRAIAAIEFSIENGYVGIYEPKGQSNTASRPGRVQAKPGKYDGIDAGAG